VLIIDFVALCDIAVWVVAFGTDDNTLGAGTGMVAVGLITAAWLLTRSDRRGFPARHEHRGGLVIYGPVGSRSARVLKNAVVARDLLLLPATELDIR